MSILLEGIAKIEEHYSLPANFTQRLLAEDDWSFVIKSHALIEAAVSGLLTSHSGYDALRPIFQRLELSDVTTGKLAFAKALNLLNDSQRNFIRKFSELRNSLVHEVRNTQFDLDSHIRSMDDNQRRAFRDAVLFFAREPQRRVRWVSSFDKEPRNALFAAVFQVVTAAKLNSELAEIQNKHIGAQLKLLEDMFAPESEPIAASSTAT